MPECCTQYCNIDIGESNKFFRMNNGMWEGSGSCVWTDNTNKKIGWHWNNPGGWIYPEVVVGSHQGQWSPTTWNALPISYSNLTSLNAEISWNYLSQPTGSWWNFAFDIYWWNISYTQRQFNIMIFIQYSHPDILPDSWYVKDVSDGINTYKYYFTNSKDWPWGGFVLKSQANQSNFKINIKALMDTVSYNLNGGWMIPDIQLGSESENGIGSISISKLNIELNGNTISLSGVKPPPPVKYKCSGSPNYICSEDPNGPYNSLAECQVACTTPPPPPPSPKYKCSGTPNYTCYEDPNGLYNSLAECQAVCKVPVEEKNELMNAVYVLVIAGILILLTIYL